MPADAIAVAIEAKTIERQMLLSVEQPLLLQALGMSARRPGRASPLRAPSDRCRLGARRGLLDGIVAELSAAWGELGAPELTRGEIDLEADAGVLTPVGEPTFSVTLASKIDGQASAISLLIPWSAIEPIADSIRGDAGLAARRR